MDFKTEFTSIKKGSDHINTSLQSKGILDLSNKQNKLNHQRLKFMSINYQELMDFNIDLTVNTNSDDLKKKIVLNENLINNDKNVINIIYTLLKELDESKSQNEDLLRELINKEDKVNTTNDEKDSLIKSFHKEEIKFNEINKKFKLFEKNQQFLMNENEQLQINNNYLKNQMKSLNKKHNVELRKKDLEILDLKEKLNFINNSKTISNTIIIKNGQEEEEEEEEEEEITQEELIALPAINKFSKNLVLDKEMEKLMIDSSDLITNLTLTNGENLSIISNTKNYLLTIIEYLKLLSNDIKDETLIMLQKPIPPKDYFDQLNQEDLSINLQVTQTLNRMKDSQELSHDLLRNLNELFGIIIELKDLNNNKQYQLEINELKKELEQVKINWKNAITTMEHWKKYRKEKE